MVIFRVQIFLKYSECCTKNMMRGGGNGLIYRYTCPEMKHGTYMYANALNVN